MVPVVGESAVRAKDDSARYQEVKAPDIPEVKDDDGTHVRVVCGNFWEERAGGCIAADPIYLDVSVPPGRRKRLLWGDAACLAYVLPAMEVCNASEPLAVPTEPVSWADTKPPAEADDRSLVLFDRGDEVMVQAEMRGYGFAVVSGNRWKSRWRGTALS